MAKGGHRAKLVGERPPTVRAQFSQPSEMFTPGWDKSVGVQQKMDRVAERAAMGNKMTPRGRGTLIKG